MQWRRKLNFFASCMPLFQLKIQTCTTNHSCVCLPIKSAESVVCLSGMHSGVNFKYSDWTWDCIRKHQWALYRIFVLTKRLVHCLRYGRHRWITTANSLVMKTVSLPVEYLVDSITSDEDMATYLIKTAMRGNASYPNAEFSSTIVRATA